MNFLKKLLILGVFFISFCFASCSRIMGHSILLWNLPDYELQDVDTVPVYVKSNISHVYIIGTEKGNVEVPIWQLTQPVSKIKIKKTIEKYSEFAHTYATVALDGLPMRAEPVNTAKQVYRLRQNEVIKILYKGKGQSVMSGKNALQGDWLRVLTNDGTEGWCFSYNLRLFKTDKYGQKIENGEQTEEIQTSNDIDGILTKTWYPENYKAMIDSGRIDIEKLVLSYNLHLDEESKILYFAMPKISEKWNYTDSQKQGENQYNLTDIPITINVKRENFIVVRYTGTSGKPEDFNLVCLEEDLTELVQNEINRREKEYEQIVMFSENLSSASYGTLQLNADHSFTWQNFKLLVPSVISSSAKSKGSANIKYFLSKTLSQSYDGVLTLKFDGMDKEVNFLFKMESNGMRFEDATGATIKNNILMERSLSPLVVFFNKQ